MTSKVPQGMEGDDIRGMALASHTSLGMPTPTQVVVLPFSNKSNVGYHGRKKRDGDEIDTR
jgi:hypothetical protein